MKLIRSSTFRIISGTIYAGKNPKIRVYDKIAEIKHRLKKNMDVTQVERNYLDMYQVLTRFEISIGRPHITLKALQEDPKRFAHYFDWLEIFQDNSDSPSGVMQFMMKHVNRKFRKQLEECKDSNLIRRIKANYEAEVTAWFD